MKNMSIGKKLILAFIIVTIISSISGVLSLTMMYSADKKYSNALVNYGFSQGDIGLLMSDLNENCTSIMTMIASNNTSDIQQAQQVINENNNKMNEYLASIKNTLVGEKENEYYKKIAEDLPIFLEHSNEVIELAVKGKKSEALKLYKEEASDHIGALNEAMNGLMNSNKTTGNTLSVELTKGSILIIGFVAVIIVACILISILIAIRISKSIANPMGLCSKRLVELSKGGLSSPVPEVDTKDEIGILAGATKELVEKLKVVILETTYVLEEMAKGNFNISHDTEYSGDFASLHSSLVLIIQSLNHTLSKINEASEQVSSGSDQVSQSAQALSQGATEQASSVEQLSATINEVSLKIKENAADATDASQLTTEVGSQIMRSNEQMQEMMQAMKEISNCSDMINKIIKTIEDIAFQTNILALNAAVEAARAGAAGKGFAVVADEVRNLASKSADAAKNTTSLIEDTIRAVENGTQLADETAQSLLSVVEKSKEAVEKVDRISTASKEQSDSIVQIMQGMEQISGVVQTNSATAQESAAASEELSRQAQLLKQLVEEFRLKEII